MTLQEEKGTAKPSISPRSKGEVVANVARVALEGVDLRGVDRKGADPGGAVPKEADRTRIAHSRVKRTWM